MSGVRARKRNNAGNARRWQSARGSTFRATALRARLVSKIRQDDLFAKLSPGTDIAAKVAHVRAAKQTREHGCHWPGCRNQCPPAAWGCSYHWYLLPPSIRTRLWRAYSIGQENRLDPSGEYLAVAAEAQAWIKREFPHAGEPYDY